jgi:5-methyltetrahydropteroyltriglutamate--homocysteine methyltransferase
VDQLVLEFARKGYQDLPVVAKFGWDRGIGLGVIDVKSSEVETPELVATRIRRALELVPPDRLTINPDCGLRNVTGAVARAKLAAMVLGARTVRAELDAGREPIAAPSQPAPESPKIPNPTDNTPQAATRPADRTTVSQGV